MMNAHNLTKDRLGTLNTFYRTEKDTISIPYHPDDICRKARQVMAQYDEGMHHRFVVFHLNEYMKHSHTTELEGKDNSLGIAGLYKTTQDAIKYHTKYLIVCDITLKHASNENHSISPWLTPMYQGFATLGVPLLDYIRITPIDFYSFYQHQIGPFTHSNC